ncbi:MAG TPA: HNH endonuclease [Deltaproteobacteria bacterium]|nr:HNH endonuclease [Deltaproteobacteria bacterium]
MDFDGVDEAAIKREKATARTIRKSRWWQNRISRGECYYCRAKCAPQELTMDHLVPIARGGKSVKGNLVPCCKECNNKKKILLPLEWQEYMDNLDKNKV